MYIIFTEQVDQSLTLIGSCPQTMLLFEHYFRLYWLNIDFHALESN